MISLIRGTLVEATAQYAIIDAAGVGFELGISSMTAAALPALGTECRLYARLQVREDSMTLFGFASKEERAMFDHLLSVSGVGPRLALAILSRYSVSQLERKACRIVCRQNINLLLKLVDGRRQRIDSRRCLSDAGINLGKAILHLI